MSVLVFQCGNCGRTVVIEYLRRGEECLCKYCGVTQKVPRHAYVTGDFPGAPEVRKVASMPAAGGSEREPHTHKGVLRRKWSMPAEPVLVRAYCLRCYASMQANDKTCDACGATNLTADRLKYWTREGMLVWLEKMIKLFIVMLTVGLCLVLALIVPHRGGASCGWFIALPIFFGMALWWTASCLTRRVTTFRPSIFWGAFMFIVSLIFVPGCVAAVVMSEISAYALLIPLTTLSLSILFFKSGRLFAKWKKKRVEQMQNKTFGT